LVEVAWADGDVSHAERAAILHIAKQRGVEPGSADHRQLLNWLDHRPPEDIVRTALEAIRIGISVLPPAEKEQRISAIIKACKNVAEAGDWLSGLLQLEGISRDESAVIAAICRHLGE
jgi:tellurite resistance protein